MKKVFVSIPLKGRSKEEIQDSLDKIKAAVEGLLDTEVEVLHQDVKDLPDFGGDEDADDNLEFLGKDIQLMADADYFATIEDNWNYRHCVLEEDIFRKYKNATKNWEEIKDNMFKFSMNIVAPDVSKKEREMAKKLFKMEFPMSERDEMSEVRDERDTQD